MRRIHRRIWIPSHTSDTFVIRTNGPAACDGAATDTLHGRARDHPRERGAARVDPAPGSPTCGRHGRHEYSRCFDARRSRSERGRSEAPHPHRRGEFRGAPNRGRIGSAAHRGRAQNDNRREEEHVPIRGIRIRQGNGRIRLHPSSSSPRHRRHGRGPRPVRSREPERAGHRPGVRHGDERRDRAAAERRPGQRTGPGDGRPHRRGRQLRHPRRPGRPAHAGDTAHRLRPVHA